MRFVALLRGINMGGNKMLAMSDLRALAAAVGLGEVQTLLHSGRPVMLAPPELSDDFDDRIAIGWNGSAQAVRAMTSALPLLATARETVLLVLGEAGEASAQNALDYLAWHDVRARSVQLPIAPRAGLGQQLLAQAAAEGAGLLAIGAYGHMPGRELLFGGATREILAATRIPLLLAH